MGMFDLIVCRAPLPDGYISPERQEFQTKDFECTLSTYTITEDGRLICDDWHYEVVPPEERRDPNSVVGCLRRVVDRADVDQNFHGDLHFGDRDREYIARFTEGKLTRITAEPEEQG